MKKLMYRSWFYFRTGYSIYIAFFVGFFSNIIVIYSLGIKPVIESGTEPGTLGALLQLLFPHLTNFVVIAAVFTSPICIYVGLLHMKKTGAFATEASVSLESNPYVYKVVPGKEQEVILPLMIMTARGLAKVMNQQQAISVEEKKEFDDVLSKADKLLAGQVVGLPRRRNPSVEVQKSDEI